MNRSRSRAKSRKKGGSKEKKVRKVRTTTRLKIDAY